MRARLVLAIYVFYSMVKCRKLCLNMFWVLLFLALNDLNFILFVGHSFSEDILSLGRFLIELLGWSDSMTSIVYHNIKDWFAFAPDLPYFLSETSHESGEIRHIYQIALNEDESILKGLIIWLFLVVSQCQMRVSRHTEHFRTVSK